MKHSGLKGETERLIVSAQDHAINTRDYYKHVMKQGLTDKCRMTNVSGCQTLATEKYLNRHNQVAAQCHLDICMYYGTKVMWPDRVIVNDKLTALCHS